MIFCERLIYDEDGKIPCELETNKIYKFTTRNGSSIKDFLYKYDFSIITIENTHRDEISVNLMLVPIGYEIKSNEIYLKSYEDSFIIYWYD